MTPYTPDTECTEPTEAHTGRNVRRYWTPTRPTGDVLVLCEGCAARFGEVMELHEERRAEPDRKAWSLRLRRKAA